jgi:hypothetical protein
VTDWEAAAAFALTLQGTALSTSYGRPAVKVDGKAFLFISREPGSFGISSPLGEKELLMETDPGTFWETDHYRGWPAVLVRHGSTERERIELVIRRAWWDKAPAKRRKAFGERP